MVIHRLRFIASSSCYQRCLLSYVLQDSLRPEQPCRGQVPVQVQSEGNPWGNQFPNFQNKDGCLTHIPKGKMAQLPPNQEKPEAILTHYRKKMLNRKKQHVGRIPSFSSFMLSLNCTGSSNMASLNFGVTVFLTYFLKISFVCIWQIEQMILLSGGSDIWIH